MSHTGPYGGGRRVPASVPARHKNWDMKLRSADYSALLVAAGIARSLVFSKLRTNGVSAAWAILVAKMLGDFYLQSSNVRGGSPVVYFAGKRVDIQSVEDRLGTAVLENGQAMRMPDCLRWS